MDIRHTETFKYFRNFPFIMEDYHFQSGRRPQYKSRMERDIGEFLVDRQIPFIYEKPTSVMDRGLLRLVYPDFTLQYGMLVEYFGMTGNREYIEQARHKLRVYQENQLDTIPLYPQDIIPGWQNRLVDRIGHTLEKRLTAIRR